MYEEESMKGHTKSKSGEEGKVEQEEKTTPPLDHAQVSIESNPSRSVDSRGAGPETLESQKLVSKMDWYVMPLLVAVFAFLSLDRNVLGYSAVFGLQKGLHLTSDDFSWTSSIFFFGHLIGLPFHSRLVQRFQKRLGTYISLIILSWGVIVSLTAVCRNRAGLFSNRFFLGFIEAAMFPASILIYSIWYTRKEQALRSAFVAMGQPIGTIVGGLLGRGIGELGNTKVETWKLFYIIFGSVTFLFGIVCILFLPNHPCNSKFLEEDERSMVIERVKGNLDSNQVDWKWDQFWEFFKDPQTYLLFPIFLLNTVASIAASTFGSLVVNSFGFSALQTTVLSSVPVGLIQIAILAGTGFWASRSKHQIRLLLSAACNALSLAGSVLMRQLPEEDKVAKLMGFYLTSIHQGSSALAISLVASNFSGSAKKTTAATAMSVAYSAGAIAGPKFFNSDQRPMYTTAFTMLVVTSSSLVVLPLMLRVWYMRENSRRNRLFRKPDADVAKVGGLETEGEEDLTDFQREREFRYVM